MKLELTLEGAQALRDFADALPDVLQQLADDTDELIAVYNDVSETMGPHEENFSAMLRCVANAQKTAEEAISVMPGKMVALAQSIEEYVRTRPSI